ncbi:hypothetical protein [Nonomuraea sp. NPDC050783]|uniref:hypothetical protein n=1 Tax=Nonomuraea sp. NPDC050783 TaxID=3154634 RepID=UPI003465FD85
MFSTITRGGRRLAFAGAGLAAALTAGLALAPPAAGGATITQMAAQGDLAKGSLACAGPFAAEAADAVAGSGTAFTLNEFGVPVGVAVDWQLRRADPADDFFADAEVVQTEHTDFFVTSVQAPNKWMPGDFWVCLSTGSRTPVHYKAFVGNGLPA